VIHANDSDKAKMAHEMIAASYQISDTQTEHSLIAKRVV